MRISPDPGAKASLRVQVSVPSTQVQPVPAMLVALSLAGIVSVTVTTPLFGAIFFFNDTTTSEIYTLSLHDALPIYLVIVRSGSWLIVVASLAESLAVLV